MKNINEKWVLYKESYRIYNTGRVFERLLLRDTVIWVECSYYLRDGRYRYIFAKEEDGRVRRRVVHIMVATAFCKRKSEDQVEVNHKDGNKLNNEYCNLEWTTHLENMRHAFRTKLCDNSLHKGNQKLSKDDVLQIRRLAAEGVGVAVLRKKFNMGQTAIRNIIDRLSWKTV